MILSQLEFLGENTSLIVLPQDDVSTPQVYFSPKGKELKLIESLGFTVIRDLGIYAKTCGLGKYAAASAVGSIIDEGGCAYVSADPDNSGKYCLSLHFINLSN